MKTNLLMRQFILLLGIALLFSVSAKAQTDQLHVRRWFTDTYVSSFSSPYKTIRLSILEDAQHEYFSEMELLDSTLIFKSERDYNHYISARNSVTNKREREEKKKEQAAKKGKSYTPETIESVKLADYTAERDFLKPGLEVKVAAVDVPTIKKVFVEYIIVKTDFDKHQTIKGFLERLDKDIATVDGQAVRLKSNVVIKGERTSKSVPGLLGQSFPQFEKKLFGTIIKVRGKFQNDGVLLAESATAEYNDFTDVDQKIRNSIKSSLQVNENANQIVFADSAFKIIKSREIRAYVSRVGEKVVPGYIADLPDGNRGKIDFNFHVIENPTFNACAYPDGTVFVNTGLLMQVQNEAQLAAVLGHELAHATNEHGRENYEANQTAANAQIAGMVLSVLLQSNLPYFIGAFGGPLGVSQFGKSLEMQADRIGLTYMYNAGYDPREAPKIWGRLYAESQSHLSSSLGLVNKYALKASSGVENVYATHPSAQNRFRQMNRLIAQNYQNQDLDTRVANTEEFDRMQFLLKGILKGESESEMVTRWNLRKKKPEVKPSPTKPEKKGGKKTPTKKP